MLKRLASMAVITSTLLLSLSITGCSDSSDDPPPPPVTVAPLNAAELAELWQDPTNKAVALVDVMSNDELLGQTIMLDFSSWGRENNSDEYNDLTILPPAVTNIINQYALGGIALFSNNLQTTEQSYNLIKSMQAARYKLPLLLAVNQEGGLVAQLQSGTETPGNMALAATHNPEYAFKAGQIHGRELNAVGINVNFAPIVDVNSNQANPVIGLRSFGSDVHLVQTMAEAYIKGLNDQNVLSTIKHFPGHGSVALDSHSGMVVVEADEATWRSIDLPPFKHTIQMENGADFVMTAHVAVPSIDSSIITTQSGVEMPIPATLSEKILTGILRNELQFNGIVFSDSMLMGAISEYFEPEEAMEQVFLAGVNISLMPITIKEESDIAKLEHIFTYLKQRMAANPLLAERIRQSAIRVVEMKLKNNITFEQPPLDQALTILASPAHKAVEKEIAEKAVTLVQNLNNTLPINLSHMTHVNFLLIADTNKRSEIITSELNAINEKLPTPIINSAIMTIDMANTLSTETKTALTTYITDVDYVVLTTHQLNSNSAINAQTIIDLVKAGNKKLIIIASFTPYDIAYLTLNKIDAYLAIYGMTGYDITNNWSINSLEANMRAGIRSLFIADGIEGVFNNPTGKLPVDIKNSQGTTQLFSVGHGVSYSE